LRTRLRFLLARKTHRDVDDELQFHLDQQIIANVEAGIPPTEARRQAAIDFGGIERTREECRQQRPGFLLEALLQDVRYAICGFRRNPIFTITVVATLVLGIGATTAVFSVVDRILFRSLPYAHADRLVTLGLVQPLEKQEFMLGAFYYDFRDNQKPFAAMTSEGAVTPECDLTDRNPAQLSCPHVEANFLPTLGISPVLGRNFLPEEGRPHGPAVGLISYGLWLTHYNRDPGILDKTIEIDGKPVQVIGVLPKDFEMPRLQAADVLLPMAVDEAEDRSGNSGLGGPRRTFARLKPGVSVAQARAELEPLYQNALKIIPVSFRSQFKFSVRSLRDRQMEDVRVEAWVLLGAVLAVLLIACANVASLLMARGAMRQRELAIRSALGASRTRLASQALTEALVLSLAGAVGGCILAEVLLRIFIAIAPASIPYIGRAQLDLRIIVFTVVISILNGMLFGLAPALQRPNGQALSGRSLLQGSHASLRRWLVVAQIAVSMVLLVGAMLLFRSFSNLENQHLGMRTDNVLTIRVTLGEHNYPSAQAMMMFFQQLQKRLQFGPGVSHVAISDSLPPEDSHSSFRYDSIIVSGRPPSTEITGGLVTSRSVSPEYFPALGIPIVRGEGFREEQLNSSGHFIVLSQQLAERLFPGEDPLGKRLNFDLPSDPNRTWYTIVGVAANVKNGGLTGEEVPEYYLLRRNRAEDWAGHGVWGRTSVIIVRTSLPSATISPWIRSQVAALDPTLPVDIATLQQRVSKLADQPRFQTLLVGFFAATGLLLAVIGLYGVISFLVTQRTQEIGVRMALGAGRMDILRLVAWEGMRLIGLGGVLGLCIALGISQVLKSLLFSIGPHDPITFLSVALLLSVTALAATFIPARAAMKVDPNVALRYE